MEEKLLTVFRTVFDDPELSIHDDMTAEDHDAWDSLVHINLVMAIEKEFGIRFKNAEVARLENVGDLKKLIIKYTS